MGNRRKVMLQGIALCTFNLLELHQNAMINTIPLCFGRSYWREVALSVVITTGTLVVYQICRSKSSVSLADYYDAIPGGW